jgi:hypothetical protein
MQSDLGRLILPAGMVISCAFSNDFVKVDGIEGGAAGHASHGDAAAHGPNAEGGQGGDDLPNRHSAGAGVASGGRSGAPGGTGVVGGTTGSAGDTGDGGTAGRAVPAGGNAGSVGCESDADCDDGDSCTGQESCSTQAHECEPGVDRKPGSPCTSTAVKEGVCRSVDGQLHCTPAGCGNRVVEAGEACDDGRNGDQADGCRDDCTYSCVTQDECRDEFGDCDGVDICNPETHRCEEGEPTKCSPQDACHTVRCDPVLGCVQTLVDEDHDQHAPMGLGACGTDCDDGREDVYLGAQEVIGDEVDQDCDGQEVCFVDADGDGVRVSSTVQSTDPDCGDEGEATLEMPGNDCDDDSPDRFPGNTERCDGKDNDCNGRADFPGELTDADKDGSLDCADCDDADSAVHPGAKEIVGDGIDQDCDGRELCFADQDGDGSRTAEMLTSEDLDCTDAGEATLDLPAGDCDDTSACVRPERVEACNFRDDNCDGGVDEACVPILSAGTFHNCAVRTDSAAQCWGSDVDHQAEPPAEEFAAVTSGWNHSCGIRLDHTVACWGNNAHDRSTPPSGAFVAVSAGWNHTCGIRPYRTLECWGNDDYGQATPLPGLFVSVSAGGYHTCALGTDGTVECWGYSSDGRATAPPGKFSAVSAGGYHSCAVREEDGAAQCWGGNEQGQLDAPGGRFLTVSAGGYHTCGLRADGTVACWGLDDQGQSTAPGGVFAAVSSGYYHTCGLRQDGSVECWGSDSEGQRAAPRETQFSLGEVCAAFIDPNQLGPFVRDYYSAQPQCSPGCADDDDYVVDWGTIHTFSYTIPPNAEIVDVVLKGTWGVPGYFDGSAPSQVFLDGVLVAECERNKSCWLDDGVWVDWSFSFRNNAVADFPSLFEDGAAELSVKQLGPYTAASNDIELTVFTQPAGS